MINKMKKLRLSFVVAGITLLFLTLNSCMDDGDYSLGDMWYSVATAVPLGDDSFYLKLDGGKTLYPSAPLYIGYKPDRPQRVQINYTILGDNWPEGYDHAIKLNRLDTILTKPIAENLGAEKNDQVYGKDPAGIESVWVGDGYLNVIFYSHFSGTVKHYVNLLQDTAADDPYKLEFRHNAYGDRSSDMGYGIVAFDLSSLPDTEGREVTLEIKLHTFEGEKTVERKYTSGENADKETKLKATRFENVLK
jgi:hypothetical protein